MLQAVYMSFTSLIRNIVGYHVCGVFSNVQYNQSYECERRFLLEEALEELDMYSRYVMLRPWNGMAFIC